MDYRQYNMPYGYGNFNNQQYQMRGYEKPFDAPISEVRFLSEKEMPSFKVMPSQTVLLIDTNNKKATLKSAGINGLAEIKEFSFCELGEKQDEIKEKLSNLEKIVLDLQSKIGGKNE